MRLFTVFLGVLTFASVSVAAERDVAGQTNYERDRRDRTERGRSGDVRADRYSNPGSNGRSDPCGTLYHPAHDPGEYYNPAHTHPDDRIATVIAGTWYIGYGTLFDEKKLKALTPGSFYTEPGGEAHFARTGKKPVVIQITGYGPTGTEYTAKENIKTK